jgi:hypothetical protein
VKRDGHREPGENEVGRIKECVSEAFRVTERAPDQNFDRIDRVFTDQDHHKSGTRKATPQIQINGIRP